MKVTIDIEEDLFAFCKASKGVCADNDNTKACLHRVRDAVAYGKVLGEIGGTVDDDDKVKDDDPIGNIFGFSNEEIKAKKKAAAKAAKHVVMSPCVCGAFPHIERSMKKKENGDIWGYEIYCTDPDCPAYFLKQKMIESGEDPFEVEEDARKEWNRMVEENS